VRRAARFATWVRVWRAGRVPYDDVAVEVTFGEEHLVADLPGTWSEVALADALPALSKLTPDAIRLVLPAPGDPRGLPGPGPLAGAAIVAGEAVVAGACGWVPEVRTHVSGSGDEFSTVLWRVYEVPAPARPVFLPDTAEAEAELSTALATATATLARLDVAAWRPGLAGALRSLRRPDGAGDLPPGYDPRARRLYARAVVLDRMLALAADASPGGAVNGYEAIRREEALRPLATACRHALMAACNAVLT